MSGEKNSCATCRRWRRGDKLADEYEPFLGDQKDGPIHEFGRCLHHYVNVRVSRVGGDEGEWQIRHHMSHETYICGQYEQREKDE